MQMRKRAKEVLKDFIFERLAARIEESLDGVIQSIESAPPGAEFYCNYELRMDPVTLDLVQRLSARSTKPTEERT